MKGNILYIRKLTSEMFNTMQKRGDKSEFLLHESGAEPEVLECLKGALFHELMASEVRRKICLNYLFAYNEIFSNQKGYSSYTNYTLPESTTSNIS